jgi:hypothetical protein
MIERLYSRLDLQLVTISAALAISFLLSYLMGTSPLLRFSISSLLVGVFGGLAIILSEVGYAYLTIRSKRRYQIESYFSNETADTLTLAKSLVQSAGEETLIRGFIFAPLVNTFNFFGSTIIALIINAAISTVIYSTRDKISYFRAIQATILAIIYLSTHSIFAVIIARFVGEVSLILASHYRLPNLILKRFSHVSKQAI